MIRIQNAFLRTFFYGYNAVMGPNPEITVGTSLDAAANAAAGNGRNQNENAIGGRISQYVQIIFIGKLDRFWRLRISIFDSFLSGQ